MARIRIMRVPRALLGELFKQNKHRHFVFTGLPADAKLLSVSDDHFFETDDVALKFESDSFAECTPSIFAQSYHAPLILWNAQVRTTPRPCSECHGTGLYTTKDV
jgi:hypothetical protein